MLEALVGNRTAAKILFYLHREGGGFAGEMARKLGIPLNMVQKQLQRFARGRLLKPVFRGNRKFFFWNRRHPGYHSLMDLIRATSGKTVNDLPGEPDDPASGIHLTMKERIRLAESLSREGEKLNFHDNEIWEKKQKQPQIC